MPKRKQATKPSLKHLLEVEKDISYRLCQELELEKARRIEEVKTNNALQEQLERAKQLWISETELGSQRMHEVMLLTMETTKQKHQLEIIGLITEGKSIEAIASVLQKDLFTIGVQVVNAG